MWCDCKVSSRGSHLEIIHEKYQILIVGGMHVVTSAGEFNHSWSPCRTTHSDISTYLQP